MKPATRTGHGDLAASLVLIFPLLLAYEVGVLFAGTVNGADVITRAVYGVLGRTTYLLVYAAIALVFLMWIRREKRWTTLSIDVAAAAQHYLRTDAMITATVRPRAASPAADKKSKIKRPAPVRRMTVRPRGTV